MRLISLIPLSILLLITASWGGLALWYDGFESRLLASISIAIFLFLILIILFKVRPYARALLLSSIPIILLICCWFSISPSNDRDWSKDVSRLARAQISDDNILRIQNVRNFDYSSDSSDDQRWDTRSYDLNKLSGVDMFLSYWGPRVIAHTITSWEFTDGSHLAISIETRKEKGEEYSAVRGFFRQYELYYVIADERDVVGFRTNHNDQQVYLYRLRMSKEEARALLVKFLGKVNKLAEAPSWYNALSHNCTTTIRNHVSEIAPSKPWNWRILANGHLDELGYMRGTVDNSMPFAQLRKLSNIAERAKKAGNKANFSELIRVGLPGERTKEVS